MGENTKIWVCRGDIYVPSSAASNVVRLPPAIYKFEETPEGWFLERTSNGFVFPYKIYGMHDDILDRVKKAWHSLPTNVGVLLNGLKGTGKTLVAQRIVNWAIEEGIAVLNVVKPIPLATVIERLNQPVLVLFDEFEKTHEKSGDKNPQKQLLSAIDGLSKNEHKRLFLFTTNVATVDENYNDRPGRIRYRWEFERLGNDVIEMMLDDMLDKELVAYRNDIMSYLTSREVLTVDVVKAVVSECNTFKEGPSTFKKFMNLSERVAGGFVVEVIDDAGVPTTVCEYYKTRQGQWLQSIMSKSGRENFLIKYVQNGVSQSISSIDGQTIEVLAPTDKDDEWVCYIQVRSNRTWVGNRLARCCEKFLWLDEQPPGWKIPGWATKFEGDEELNGPEDMAKERWAEICSVFGTSRKKKVRVRFTAEKAPSYNFKEFIVS